MPGFNNGVVYADNVSFDGTAYPGKVTTDGQLLIGSSVAPNIRVATIAATVGQGVSVTNGNGTITLSGIDASTLSKGVILLATDAETIAGLLATVVTTPSNITAKLGLQTANSFVYGTGPSNALGWTNAATDGQILVGSSIGAPAATNIASGTNISVSNAHNSITISSTGAVPSSFSTDSGSAIPALNSLTVSGSNGVATSGSGSTVTVAGVNATTTQIGVSALATNAEAIAGTVNNKNIIPSSLSAKLGTQTANSFPYGTGATNAIGWTAAATNGEILIGSTGNPPVAATLTQGTAISISNAAGSITIGTTDSVPTTFNADSGSATPSSNAITFSGGTGISTSATGAAVTVNASSATSAAKGIVQLATLTEVETGTDAAKSLTPSTFTGYMGDLNFSGFMSWAAGTPYWSNTGNTFNLLVGGSGYILGQLITWIGSQSVGMTAKATNWIYINSAGTLAVTQTRTDALFVNNIVLFEAWVDASGSPKLSVVRENHPYNFAVSDSNYQHAVINTIIANYNNGANIILVGTDTIGISGADTFEDHGLSTAIPDSGGAAVTWNFCYTNASGFWVLDHSGTTFPASYNNAGTLTALVNGYAVFRLYMSKDSGNASTPTYYAIYDTAKYTSQANANNAISNGSPATPTNELSYIELAQLGFITVQQSSTTITNVVIQKATARAQTTTSGTNQASLITVNTSGFTGWLGASDTTVQQSLVDLDQVLIGGTLGYVLEGQGAGNKPIYVAASNILTWQAIGASQTLAINNGYICNSGANLSLALPATSSVGNQIIVTLAGSTSWKITQAAGQQIQIGSNTSTSGATGYISSNTIGDTVTLVCIQANNIWQAIGMIGNINYH